MPKRVNQHSALPMPERFTTKTAKNEIGCWIFSGCIDEIGYGRFPYMGENKAHRVSYRLFKGEIPQGMMVLHKCDVRSCVNPDHLFLGTQTENMKDMAAKGRGKYPTLKGEQNPMSKLDKSQVDNIRAMVAAGSKQIDAVRKYGVSPMTVSRIVRNETWK